MHHAAGGFQESGLADVMAGFLLFDRRDNEISKFRVCAAATGDSVEVVVGLGEEAGADFAVGSEADAAALSAKRLGNGGDNADFADSVVEGVAAGRFARVGSGKGNHGPELAQAVDHFTDGDNGGGGPEAVFLQRHEFDEADDDAFFAGETGKSRNLLLVEAAQQHAVHLDRVQAGAFGGADSAEHLLEAVGNAGDAGEGRGIDRVHADGDAGESCIFQRLGEIGEQVAVGGNGDVERLP